MSEEKNVQVVQGIYASFAVGDIPAILAQLSPKIEWHQEGTKKHVPFFGTTYRGPNDVGQFFSLVNEHLEPPQAFEVRHIVSQGETVVALGYYKFRVRSTGKVFESHFAHAWLFSGDGKIIKYRQYVDTESVAIAFQN